MCRRKETSPINAVGIHSTPTFSLSKQLVSITDDISRRHAVRSYFELPALWMSAKQPLPVSAEHDDLISQPVFRRMCVTQTYKSMKDQAGFQERMLTNLSLSRSPWMR